MKSCIYKEFVQSLHSCEATHIKCVDWPADLTKVDDKASSGLIL